MTHCLPFSLWRLSVLVSTLALPLATVAQVDGAGTSNVKLTLTEEQDSYEIYSMLLRTEMGPEWKIAAWAIDEQTQTFPVFASSNDEHLRQCLSVSQDQKSIYQPLIQDYLAKNQKKLVLERKFDLPQYALVGFGRTSGRANAAVAASIVFEVSAVGFKILVDLLASSGRPVRIAEVPYTFRVRQRGESKLDILVGVEYLELLVDKLVGNLIPPQFVLFGLVGAVGVVLHLAILWLGLNAFALPFAVAQAIGAVAAMTLNFFLNNSVTYRGNRLHGWSVWTGLLSFYAACSIGVLINMEIADRLRSSGLYWALAGVLGLAVGSVWNYGVTRVFTWRMNRHRARLHATSALREASPPPT